MDIAKTAKMDPAMIRYLGAADLKVRAKNDKKIKSLLSRGHITSKAGESAVVYSITATGRKAVAT